MSGQPIAGLPGHPGPRLAAAWMALTPARRAALAPHLLGTTSADYVAGWLARAGHQVSASTIRTYRRSLHPQDRVSP
ncbi:hypothetical protein GCM10010124_02440 [Pilimelia terevasa]|uniref:Uncharacterized protein n=1 Tax=Pilimelia terevasa TaxID=53372 RepID=A0A8J3FFL9_9ACTN|nr:hypothetical protein [Pilimelia terevasa]GGK13401.1 hypothetical protein GCM10010124_02440 [Pilimelia terevasa]